MKSNFESNFIEKHVGPFDSKANAEMQIAWQDVMKQTPASLKLPSPDGGGKLEVIPFEGFKSRIKAEAKRTGVTPPTDKEFIEEWRRLNSEFGSIV